ncbi:lmo0937 family membrane protein [Massilia consociata]|uniref:Lmo0937 family membrane protein n=1 Tax=Massilia consociata TaxID=760117 RepID=A0ABV6FHK6_9BURK
MLYTIAIILLVLWLLGMATSVAGGLIHILLVAAAVVILIRLFTGRKVL